MTGNTLPEQDAFTAAMSAIDRYGLITPSALAKLFPKLFPELPSAVSLLQRLEHHGSDRKAPLSHECDYYFQGERPLAEAAKTRAYAMLAICAFHARFRSRLTRCEFQQYFPDLCRPGLPMNYYVDVGADAPTLGFVRVDLGGHSRWDRIVAKAMQDARKHSLEPAFDRFRNRQSLEIRIVTALPQKADRIRRAIQDHPNDSPIPIQISVVPALINLIAPIRRAPST